MIQLTKLGFKLSKDERDDLVAGAVAGAGSNLVIYPVDTIKDTQKQYQAQNRALAEQFQKGLITEHEYTHSKLPVTSSGVIKHLWKHERGLNKLRAFYKGVPMSVAKIAPASALSFMLYGLAKKHLEK